MHYKPLEDVVADDLDGLLDAKAEDRRIEYKLTFVTTEKDKAEVLKDVSAFANSGGGDIIYGMAAVKGVASKLCPIETSKMDDEKNRLHQILDAGITPRIPNIDMHPVEVEDGKSVLVVRIPSSHIGPHQVTGGQSYKFHGRNTAGTYPIEVDELRDMIVRRASLPEQMRSFRRERVELIRNRPEDMPLAVEPPKKLILHFLPLETFGTVGQVNAAEFATDMVARNAVTSRLPVRSTGVGLTDRPNIDGFVFMTGHGDARYPFYVQVFNDGSIEFVDATAFVTLTESAVFAPTPVEENMMYCYLFVRGIFDVLKIRGPVHIFMTALGLRDNTMVIPEQYLPRGLDLVGHSTAIGRDPASFPEVLVDDMHLDPRTALYPVIAQLWRAAAYERPRSFDAEGRYKGDPGGSPFSYYKRPEPL